MFLLHSKENLYRVFSEINGGSLIMDIDTLKTCGYVDFSYPSTLSAAVEGAVKSWKRFCTLPYQEKKKLSGGDRITDFGYMSRGDEGPRSDHKELFHVSRCDLGELDAKATGINGLEAFDFIEAIDVLIERSIPTISMFAHRVEEVYGLKGLNRDVITNVDHWTFRYLHYLPGAKMRAHPHADRGGFTLHLYENFPGGEYFDFHGNWQPWPIGDGRTIIFPSMELQYRSKGALRALWHRVCSFEGQCSQSRYAMVVFVDFLPGIRFNDAKYRIQDFDPGFNYTLPHEELDRYFIDSSKTGSK